MVSGVVLPVAGFLPGCLLFYSLALLFYFLCLAVARAYDTVFLTFLRRGVVVTTGGYTGSTVAETKAKNEEHASKRCYILLVVILTNSGTLPGTGTGVHFV